MKCIQMSKWQGANCSVPSEQTAEVFFTAGPQPGSCFPILPCHLQSERELVFQHEVSVTLTTPDRSFHTFTSCMGESVLSLEPSTFASRIRQARWKVSCC